MLLVDCYNVLHVNMPPSLAGLDEAGLCGLLGTHPWAGRFGKIIVVADGRPKPGRAATSPVVGVSLRFSGKEKTADDVIIALINEDSAPRTVTVVSSDREIQRAARARRAVVMESATLVRELAKRSARRAKDAQRPDVNEPLPKSQVEQWLTAFAADPHALGAPESPADVIRRAKAEAARLTAEQAARPRKTTYRRYRTPATPAPDKAEQKGDESVRGDKPAKHARAGEGMREKGVTGDEAQDWLREFGIDADFDAAMEQAVASQPAAPVKTVKKMALSKPGLPKAPKPVVRMSIEKMGESLDRLSDGDIDAWLRVFGLTPDEGKKP